MLARRIFIAHPALEHGSYFVFRTQIIVRYNLPVHIIFVPENVLAGLLTEIVQNLPNQRLYLQGSGTGGTQRTISAGEYESDFKF